MELRQCSSAFSPTDAFLALDYFGFPPLDLKITCADDDPLKTPKTMAFALFMKSRKSVPAMVQFIKDTIRRTPAMGYHFIVRSALHPAQDTILFSCLILLVLRLHQIVRTRISIKT